MPNRSVDALFQLIKSLKREEKRQFKLYLKQNSDHAELKIARLFDAIDKMESYDETVLLKKIKTIHKRQLSNIKAQLYKKILMSLRQLRTEIFPDVQLHEQLDYARLLYNKGLYIQSLKLLQGIKEQASAIHQHAIVLEILDFEKYIEYMHITRSFEDRAEQLIHQSQAVQEKISRVETLANLSLQLYNWYICKGHARNKEEVEEISALLRKELTPELQVSTDFYERLYLYQSKCWYAYITQDFLLYYRYA